MANKITKIYITAIIFALAVLFSFLAFNFYNESDLYHNVVSQLEHKPAPTQIASGLPVRLTIPTINVDANIIYVGLTKDGAVETPKGPAEVAWFQLGPRPGDRGSAIITGHFGPWQDGAHSVFDNLHKLKEGDTIYVTDDKDEKLAFVVTGSHLYESDESPEEVFSKTDGKYLNLITCSGEWLRNEKTYTNRLVIFTKAL